MEGMVPGIIVGPVVGIEGAGAEAASVLTAAAQFGQWVAPLGICAEQ